MLDIPDITSLLYKNKPTKAGNCKTSTFVPNHRFRQEQQIGVDTCSVLVIKASFQHVYLILTAVILKTKSVSILRYQIKNQKTTGLSGRE